MKDLTLNKFSELTSSSDPVPGGGGVCGAVSALAASLAQMVINLSNGKKLYLQYTDEYNELINELEDLRIKLLDSINEDAKCFEPLAKAYKMPKDDPNYDTEMERCLKLAASSPFNILKLTTRIIEIDERLAKIGTKISISDAATSVKLCDGVLYGAYINVLVNTRLMKDKDYANDLNTKALNLVNDYSAKANNTFNRIIERLS